MKVLVVINRHDMVLHSNGWVFPGVYLMQVKNDAKDNDAFVEWFKKTFPEHEDSPYDYITDQKDRYSWEIKNLKISL